MIWFILMSYKSSSFQVLAGVQRALWLCWIYWCFFPRYENNMTWRHFGIIAYFLYI